MMPEKRSRTFNFTWISQDSGEKGEGQSQDRGDKADDRKAVGDAGGCDRRPQGKCAVHGKVREIQNFVGDVYAKGHNSVYKSFLKNTQYDS